MFDVGKILQAPGGKTMAKHEHTSRKVASRAARILSNPRSTKAQKSVAASALTQVRNRKRG